MNEIIHELLETHQIRKTKAQKAAFLQWITPFAEAHGYAVATEKGSCGAKNIILGDPDSAKVVYTAHYDTCAVMPIPNFITPKCLPLYLLYQVALTLAIFVLAGVVSLLAGMVHPVLAPLAYGVTLWAILLLMILGPANKHTANDNTSGVATILQMLEEMPEELRKDAAFVLFDLEEAGLFGSTAFYSKHKKAMKDKLLINFDCVSDGDYFLLCIKKKARKWLPQLESAFISTGDKTVELCTKGFFYPSDQSNFPCGIGVAALKKGRFGLLYMDRIHTKRDTVFQAENIVLLAHSGIHLTQLLVKN